VSDFFYVFKQQKAEEENPKRTKMAMTQQNIAPPRGAIKRRTKYAHLRAILTLVSL
jgi:hypothetical protein